MRKYISYMLQIIKGRLAHKRIPILVTLCVTHQCNLKCIYCYREHNYGSRREFTIQELLHLIDELAGMGTKYISLNGGEALLRDDIEILVEKIKNKNLLCHLVTNGLLVEKRIALMRKIDSLAISIDGIKESNDANRGEGTYDRIIEAIKCLHKNNITFHTHTVLTKNNKNVVDEILQLARQFNFKAQFSTLRIEDSPDKTINLSDEELKGIIKKIIYYKKSGYPVFFSYSAYENVLHWPFSYTKQMLFGILPTDYKPLRCYIKRFSCHIEADGSVYPCIVLVNKVKVLNLHEVGFQKAWEHLAANTCKGCYNICCNDQNLIFGLNQCSLWNIFKIVMDRIINRVK